MIFKPSATYRIQFHKDFTFKHLNHLIPYFKELGVTTIYASPIFKAIPGSTHGYDGVNPHQINPEIGTEVELVKLTRKLKKLGISWLQDIVPNHMSFHPSNAWLMDVLENWKDSPYFRFFDINFPTKFADKRLMVPFLGEDLPGSIEKGDIQITLFGDKFHLSHGENNWPINFNSYQIISSNFKSKVGFQKSISTKIGRKKITDSLRAINKDKAKLMQICDAQYYRLCNWQETTYQINYRRFFTVNSLICLNVQYPEVFDAYHQYIFKLLKMGVFQGLRIDHVDGLANPTLYLKTLKDVVGPDVYIVVEKILGADEQMPKHWPIAGNTGYDFLAMVNNLFTNKKAEQPFTDLYHEIISKPLHVAEQIILKKKAILVDFMQGELDHLVQLYLDLDLGGARIQNAFSHSVLKENIADFLIYCPVYRFYGDELPFSESERAAIEELIEAIPKTKDNTFFLRTLSKALVSGKDVEVLSFYQRCMQFTGPLMAKGVEDTLMYTYNRFVGHTEVGDAPDAFGITVTQFHERMQQRLLELPYSMNATATHDTKRGEDVRARLNVLTDIPEKWIKLIRRLKKQTLGEKKQDFGLHQNDAYLIFQTVFGAMPFKDEEGNVLHDRLKQYVEKALRETKKRSTWDAPNEAYEERAKNFAMSLLNPQQMNYALLSKFLTDIADFSIVNSLAQLLLKFTCPGIPDTYQGTELWDLSLVDPDNRRAVDYSLRQDWLKEISADVAIEQLWEDRKSGKIKLWLTKQLFELRSHYQSLFEQGSYIPIHVKGKYRRHICAYLRSHENQWLLVIVPLGLAGIAKKDNILEFDWEDTRVILPENAPVRWLNLLSNEEGKQDILQEEIPAKDVLNKLPIALLKLIPDKQKRGSGILMPIFSLPSNFGIGDLGPEAYKFVDFLADTAQKYWQLLPLNPISEENFNSPYASDSAMAGSRLFISPELLFGEGLLSEKDIKQIHDSEARQVDYQKVRKSKKRLLHIAYVNYIAKVDTLEKEKFISFCQKEDYWLANYALYVVLHRHHQNKPWNEWPKKYKMREPKALAAFEANYCSEIEEIKWLQFVFYSQWEQLKKYANSKGIEFIGDLPFYVAYNSADVWSNPKSFKLDRALNMEVVAGVPADSLNPNGQLWGMPIFNWEYLKKDGYSWWMKRIKKNIELFDVVRIDHFRALHTYWEVGPNEIYAKTGRWVPGPAGAFLKEVYRGFKELPFVVEDLGREMEGPIILRDEFKLAGMKVLQFAFGDDFPDSGYLPHHYVDENCIAFIGTHDNNTTKGWFEIEIGEAEKERLSLYHGSKVDVKNVHKVMMRIVLASTARIAILQMQDLLGLDGKSRMNTPGTSEGNWLWRMKKNELDAQTRVWLRKQTLLFGRA